MRIPPPEVILSWPPPRYDNPETGGPANEIIAILLLTIATTIIAIRTYTRKRITNGFGWDDILVILAFIPATGFVVVGMISMDRYGWGRHIWDVPADRFTGALQMSLASQILFDLATTFTKLSMLALTYRIAREASRKFSLLVIGLEVFIAVNGVIFILVDMLQCRPLSLYWTLSAEPQDCINEAAHLLAASIINTVADFVVVLLPLILVRIVYKTKLSSRQMLIVNLLFGAGLLASFAGAARTYFTWIMTTEPDVTWNAWMNWLMSCLELFLGIICTSIPPTKPFFNRYLPRLLLSRSHKSQTTNLPIPTDKATKGSQIGSQLTLETDFEASDAIPMKSPSSTPTAAAAKRFGVGNLHKPLPAVIKKNSVYTIKIQLDEASLSPADRRDRTMNQQATTAPNTILNFSRPKVLRTRRSLETHNHLRLSTYSTGDMDDGSSRYSQATDDGSSRYSQAVDDGSSRYSQDMDDDMDTSYRHNIDDAEVEILQNKYDHRSYVAPAKSLTIPTRSHAKNPSVGTFGG